jgi:hypothetical protein
VGRGTAAVRLFAAFEYNSNDTAGSFTKRIRFFTVRITLWICMAIKTYGRGCAPRNAIPARRGDH